MVVMIKYMKLLRNVIIFMLKMQIHFKVIKVIGVFQLVVEIIKISSKVGIKNVNHNAAILVNIIMFKKTKNVSNLAKLNKLSLIHIQLIKIVLIVKSHAKITIIIIILIHVLIIAELTIVNFYIIKKQEQILIFVLLHV